LTVARSLQVLEHAFAMNDLLLAEAPRIGSVQAGWVALELDFWDSGM
jgi:hypothetical protein